MVMSGQLSSSISCMLLTLLLWLPVLSDVLGMEWLLPRLFLLQLAASLSCSTGGRRKQGEEGRIRVERWQRERRKERRRY